MVRIRSFKKKKVAITGGSSGIGFATARAFSDEGAEVIIIARNQQNLEKASKRAPGIVSAYPADISSIKDLRCLEKRIKEDHEGIDILINSAGIVYPGTLMDLTIDQIERTLNIDLKGTMITTKVLLPLIRSPGYIMNISSVAGFIGLFGYTAYSAAKFGVWGFSQALRMELEPRNIGVGVVFPPDTNTPQLEFENRTKPHELRGISKTIEPIPPARVATSIVKGIMKGEFMIFPDSSSRSAYHANRLMGAAVRGWMDKKVNSAGRK
ncbi:MAG: SDR family NAD(P)-dependent oxidoreductase [Thermoplasmatota archaeon]